ncbi:MAG TPA: hypothetical protein VGE29_15020 [Prosthecobacter sp.]
MDESIADAAAEIRESAEARLFLFQEALKELDEAPTELAKRLYRLGDHRSPKVIVRGIQRMMAGETGVSGEMLVIATLLVRERRRLLRQYSDLQWQPLGKESLTTIAGEFKVTLHPQSKGRWKVDLFHIKTGNSPSWQQWPEGLESAKKKALVYMEDAFNEMYDQQLNRDLDAA